ncbi:MAG: flavodoxin family protein [Dehalococcoidaceae bacterium]|nr:flavodoxin family protein [Dehalococcoidaceae bacterium]
MTDLSVLGIGASPRKRGNSDMLLRHILKGVRSRGVSCEDVQLRDYQFSACTGCEKCRNTTKCTGLQDGMQLLYPKLAGARGLVLVSPTHNYNMTVWMKAFIDRLYCLYMFTDDRPRRYTSSMAGQGRKMVLGAVGEQPTYEEAIGFTLDAMRLPFEALGYETLAQIPVLGIFDKGRIAAEVEILERAEAAGAQLAKAVSCTPGEFP